MNPLNRTKMIGIKLSEVSFEALRKIAESEGKPLGEWCRDILMKAVLPPPPRPSELAMVAEISATQDMLIEMLMAIGRDRMSTQRAQEIVDQAQNAKYKDALNFLRFAYLKAEKLNLEVLTRRDSLPRAKEQGG